MELFQITGVSFAFPILHQYFFSVIIVLRLLLLAVMGLGALYLIHVLAQDYMKIRKPAAKLASFLLSKRDLDAVNQVFKFYIV